MSFGSDVAASASDLSRTVRPLVQKFSVTVLSQKHNDFDAFMAELEADPANAQELKDAGTWIADTFYAEEGETLRTVRIRKGLTQAQLAAALETSQAQIAKIESGRADLRLSTMRKLMQALDLDANQLHAMLDAQESPTRREAP